MPQTDTRRDVSLYPLSLFWRWQRQEVLISYRWVIIWLRRLRSSLTMSLNWEWTPISSGEKQDINDCVSSHLIFFAVLSIAFFPLSDIMWTGFACSSPVSSPLFSWFYSMGKSSGQSGSLWFSLSSAGVCLGKPWPAKRIFASKKTLKNPKEKNKTWKYLDVFFFKYDSSVKSRASHKRSRASVKREINLASLLIWVVAVFLFCNIPRSLKTLF